MNASSPGLVRTVSRRVKTGLERTLPPPAYRRLLRGYGGVRVLMRRNAGRGRVLPEFVVIGAAKAGTTTLYDWISDHPCVLPATWKEVHYFDYSYFDHTDGEDWYRSHFPLRREMAALAAELGQPCVTGEASPSYVSHAWAPQRIKELLPNAKLILSMRNPVDRAYSHFQMSRREGQETIESFMDALAAEEDRLRPEYARCQADPRYNSWPIGCWSYLMRGRYAEQIERWFELFPREQFHFVTLEEFSTQPRHTLERTYAFLGLPPHTPQQLAPRGGGRYDPLSPDTRAWLTDYFRPHNERLYELLGIDYGWD